VAEADWNEEANIGLNSKGFFKIFDGTNFNRFKLLQDVTIDTVADFEKFYTDDYTKILKSTGDSSTFEFRTKKTADLFDDVSPPTDKKTISFFQNQIINDRVIPEAKFEGVQDSEGALSKKFIHVEFDAFVTSITDARDPATGAPEIVVSGEIKKLIRSVRTNNIVT